MVFERKTVVTFTDPNHPSVFETSYQFDTRRTIVWNEENRIESIADQGHVKTYKYDDQGTRTIKRGPQGETVYVNQFFTQRPGATGTKHVYASLYAYSVQSPVRYKDDDGNAINFVVGAAVGFVADVAVQVAVQMATGQEIDIDIGSALISAGVGATGVGFADVAKNAVRGLSAAKQLSKAQTAVVEVTADIAAETTTSVIGKKARGEEVTLEGVVLDVAVGKAAGEATSSVARARAARSSTNAQLTKSAERAERLASPVKASGTPRRVGRPEARQRQAQAARCEQMRAKVLIYGRCRWV